MRLAALAALVVCAGCGGDDDPCADVEGACVTVEISSSDVSEIDQLELDVLYGDRHATTSTQADGGRVVALPIRTAITVDDATDRVGVVAAGKLSGVVLGTGAGAVTLEGAGHPTIAIRLAPPDDCVAGTLYCGGDRLAGDPDTLYACNAGGVPIARGACAHGCVTHPADDDACAAGPEACMDGGRYCGGDELAGDPQTLYTCTAGAGTAGVECADGCRVAPAGSDDACAD